MYLYEDFLDLIKSSKRIREKADMRNLGATLRNFLFAILLPALFLIIIYGCAPKIYLSSYSDPKFNFSEIKKVAIVLEKSNVTLRANLLFAEIFTQTALQRKKFFLVRGDYFLEDEISKPDLCTGADAFLKISLTHYYSGYRTRFLPTSIGAYAKLVETAPGKTVWNMNYAYSSSKTGPSAPMIEEVMKIVVKKLIDSVPLKYTVPSLTTLEERKDVLHKVITPPPKKVSEVEKDYSKEIAALRSEFADLKEKVASLDEKIADLEEKVASLDEKRVPEIKLKRSASDEEEPVLTESLTPFKSGPYVIHVSSVQNRYFAEEFLDRKTTDGTIRLAKLVNLQSKGRWHRLLIGRFKSLDACRSYIRKSKQSGEIEKYARPVKLPFSLLISSRQALVPSQKMVQALRKKHLSAYLSPSAGKAETYDVLIGAYGSEREAARKAKILLQKGISAKIISP